MIRFSILFIIFMALAGALLWLGDQPGKIIITFKEYGYESNLVVGALAAISLILLSISLLKIGKYIWDFRQTIIQKLQNFQHSYGSKSLSEGIIAAAAGDIKTALKKNKIVHKYSAREENPLIPFLEIQLLLLETDREKRHVKLHEISHIPEISLLALKELYLNSRHIGKHEEAWSYALQAHILNPDLNWTYDAILEERVHAGDFDGALQIIDQDKKMYFKESSLTQNHKRASILTEKAKTLFNVNPEAAYKSALEACRLRPDFSPAVAIAAQILFQKNELRKASKILESCWEKEPHPEIADLYLNTPSINTPEQRLTSAQRLMSLNVNHIESNITVAYAALEAQNIALARNHAEKALSKNPRQAVWFLLAKIEEREGSNPQYIQEYLYSAVKADPEPTWIAEGYCFDHWYLQSPITGRLDVFEWASPTFKRLEKNKKISSKKPF